MKYNGVIKKSRTLDYAALLAIFGAVLQGLPMVQEQLAGNYGYVFMVVSAVVALLRLKTTASVGEKDVSENKE